MDYFLILTRIAVVQPLIVRQEVDVVHHHVVAAVFFSYMVAYVDQTRSIESVIVRLVYDKDFVVASAELLV